MLLVTLLAAAPASACYLLGEHARSDSAVAARSAATGARRKRARVGRYMPTAITLVLVLATATAASYGSVSTTGAVVGTRVRLRTPGADRAGGDGAGGDQERVRGGGPPVSATAADGRRAWRSIALISAGPRWPARRRGSRPYGRVSASPGDFSLWDRALSVVPYPTLGVRSMIVLSATMQSVNAIVRNCSSRRGSISRTYATPRPGR
jgi:hypothetical protein